jgi:type IV secretory system conjugative DNA transfer VirD4/TraG family protein
MFEIFQDPALPSRPDDLRLLRSTRAEHLRGYKTVRAKARALAFALLDRHALLIGGTRRGKTGLLELLTRAIIASGTEGASIIDPHGAYARGIIEWLAHPASGLHARINHIIDPSSAYSIGLNPLRPYDDTWESRHDAVAALISVIESRFEASPEQTPRLARVIYIAGMLCARHGLTLLELVELLSLGADELRRSLLEDFDNRVVRRDLEDLAELARKSPREFMAIVESAKNRFTRWLGDRRLARILGQKRGLDLLSVMDNRELVIADLSALNYADAALVGAVHTSMLFVAARRRPPLKCARHRLIMDEAESLITLDVARMCDQSAKSGVNIVAAIQRLGQLRARDDFIADALLTNCAIKICFGGLESESARYMAENMFAGHVDLCEWKAGSERRTPTGQTTIILKNRTRAESHTHSEMSGEAAMESSSRTSAAMSASMFSAGASFGSGASSSFASMPDHVLEHGMPLSQSVAHNNSRAASSARGRSHATSSARQHARGHARTHARASSDGLSLAQGESEALATIYESLPTQLFSLEEQWHRLTAELMSLPRREAFVRVESDAPFRARTADLTPAFRSEEFKAELLPRYLVNVARRSRYAVLNSEIDHQLATRIDTLSKTPPTKADDFEPAPVPSDSDIAARAQQLHRTMQAASAKSKSLRIIPGGKGGDSQ